MYLNEMKTEGGKCEKEFIDKENILIKNERISEDLNTNEFNIR